MKPFALSSLLGAFLLSTFPLLQAQDATVKSVSPGSGGLRDVIAIEVENLSSLVGPKGPGQVAEFVPFFDGHALKGSKLEYVDEKTHKLRFILLRDQADPDSRAAWNYVLKGYRGTREVEVSVGPKSGSPLSSNQNVPIPFDLVVFPQPWSAIALFAMVLFVGVFAFLAAFTNMLKDPANPNEKRTYSLGRCQMAWWTFLVLGSFVYIWLVTGDTTFPSSSLVLLGISGATALSAVVIDPRPTKVRGRENGKDVKALEGLLNDNNGQPAFHRFQMFAWTIILGIVFISEVVSTKAQPTLDSTLLTLMGISSGVYLGFKFRKTDDSAAQKA